MRSRIAISAGLAAVVVLSVFTMIKLDSRATADGTEIDDLISTGVVPTVAEFFVPKELITALDYSQEDELNDFVMREPVETDNATVVQAVEPQLEPIYVYPDGSIAPTPYDLLSGSSGEAGYEYNDWDDDHERYDDDDHDEEWEHEDEDDDDRRFFIEKLASGLFSDGDDDDDHDDDDRDHDDDDRDNDDD